MSAAISPVGTRGVLRQLLTPPVIITAVVVLAAYLFFDLREGGETANLFSLGLVTPAAYAHEFGWTYVIGMIALDVLLATTSAILMVQSYRAFRARRDGGTGAACSSGGSMLLGFCTFACPGCPLPILGSFGVTFFATSLPLYGLEFKVLALLLVIGALVWIQRQQKRMIADAQEDTGGVAPQGA
jgi:hypothetical protein